VVEAMRIVAVSSLFSLAVASKNSGVKKVITLLGDLKGKVEAETAQGKQDAADYEDWCIKTITETQADIKYGAEKVEENQARAEDGAAKAQANAANAAALALEIGKAQGAQKTAAAVRKEEHNVFSAKEAELVEADTMLGKAYSVLKRSLSFAQGAKTDPRTQEVVVALGAIISSASVDTPSAKQVSAFLEEEQPQATVKAYESKSGGILQTIQNMQDKNAAVLANLRDNEMGRRHDHERLMQDLKNTEESKTEQMDAAKEAAAKAEADGKQAESAAAEASDVLAADKTELADTQQGCDSAAKEWSARLAEATEEVQVLGQAIEILEGKFGSAALLQTKVTKRDGAEFEKREKAASVLRQLGRKFNQYGLIQAAQSATDDPFVKVRQMINDMVQRLEEESRKEASKEAKCKADKEKGARDLKIKKGDFERLGSRLDGANAKFVLLGDEIADLQQQLKDLSITVRAATQFRNKEKKDNAAVITDAAEAVEALSSAIGVLTDFYGAPASLLQTESKKQSDSAGVILSILQTAQEDFEKLRQDTEASESSSANKYDKDMQAADVAKAKKTALVEGKTAERSTVKVMISTISEDLSNATKAYDAAKDFLKGVMEACANKAMSFEERQARREAEIAGLKDALEILSPDTDFLQTRAFLAPH